jgi:hypothetical protein
MDGVGLARGRLQRFNGVEPILRGQAIAVAIRGGLLTATQNATHDIDYYGLQHDTPVDHGTTHLSVVDQWGGAASITSTVSGLELALASLQPASHRPRSRPAPADEISPGQPHLGQSRHGPEDGRNFQ